LRRECVAPQSAQREHRGTRRFDESQCSCPRQLFPLDMPWKVNGNLKHDVFHERQVELD